MECALVTTSRVMRSAAAAVSTVKADVTLTVVCAAFAAALEIWTPTPTQSVHALSAAAADSVMRPPESRSTARHAPLPTASALLISSCQDSAVRRAAAASAENHGRRGGTSCFQNHGRARAAAPCGDCGRGTARAFLQLDDGAVAALAVVARRQPAGDERQPRAGAGRRAADRAHEGGRRGSSFPSAAV